MIQFPFAALSAFLIIFFGVSVVFAKPPSVTSIFPSGARQGAELELKVADIPEIWPSYVWVCLLYTSPSPRDRTRSRMPSSA